MKFIKRKLKESESLKKFNFEDILLQDNSISIILGEPASGKTTQLKNFFENNKTNSQYIELLKNKNIKEELFKENRPIFLLDSIDEGLLSKNNTELSGQLEELIEYSKKQNSNSKFIISCRYLEWKELFEKSLKEIDEKLKIYEIMPITKDDINLLLKENSILENEFWNFIESNYLKNLLQNILITKNIILNFQNYKDKKDFKYTDIYIEIIKEHLTITNKDEYYNEANEKEIDIEFRDLLLISSSIATYMSFNKKLDIEKNYRLLASEIYKIENIQITDTKIKYLLNTPLFIGKGRVKFFHKSIQEFLTAYFLNQKFLSDKFNFRKLKNLISFEDGIYEEFEEVIIYLTNLNDKIFDEVLKIDTLIFRRHPYLKKDEQEKLLIATLETLQNKNHKSWGKQEYLMSSTLIYLQVENIVKVIRDNVNINSVEYSTFIYLISLFKNNYSIEFENLIFDILEDKLKDNENIYRFLNDFIAIYNKSTIKRLFYFIVDNNLIEDDYNHSRDYTYRHIFNILYNEVEFSELMTILTITTLYLYDFSYFNESIYPKLKLNELILLFEYIDLERDKYNYENQIFLIITILILNDYENSIKINTNILSDIVDKLEENSIYFDSTNNEEIFEKIIKVNFTHKLKKDFYNFYFSYDLKNKNVYKIIILLNILEFLKIRINIREFKFLLRKYNFSKYKDNYSYLRKSINSTPKNDKLIRKIFLNFSTNKKNIEDRFKNRIKLIRQRNKLKNRTALIKRQQLKKEYQNYLKNFDKDNNYFEIFDYCYYRKKYKNRDNFIEFDTNLKLDLKTNYDKYIEILKNKFETINEFEVIKDFPPTNRIYPYSIIFNYLFYILSKRGELEKFIDSSEKYEKFFYYKLNYGLEDDYFKEITESFQKEFFDLFLDSIKKSLKIKNYKGESYISYKLMELLKNFEDLNQELLNNFLTQIKVVFITLPLYANQSTKAYLINLIILDKSNHNFIFNFLKRDIENYSLYLQKLYEIDSNSSLKYFFEYIYKNKNDLQTIFSIISNNFRYSEELNLSKISDENLTLILKEYSKNFKKPPERSGVYTPDIYDEMSRVVSNIINYLSLNSKIEVLKELDREIDNEYSESIKYHLKLAINNQFKNRQFDNNYYKNIFEQNYEIIKDSKELFEYILDVIEEVKEDFEKYGLKSFLYKDDEKHPRHETFFQRLTHYILAKTTKHQKFMMDREIAVSTITKADNYVDIKVSLDDNINVILELKKDNNKSIIGSIKEQIIDKYLKDYEYAIYLIAVYSQKGFNKLKQDLENEKNKYKEFKDRIEIRYIKMY